MSTKIGKFEQIIQRYLDENLPEKSMQSFEENYFSNDTIYRKLEFEYELVKVIRLNGAKFLDKKNFKS